MYMHIFLDSSVTKKLFFYFNICLYFSKKEFYIVKCSNYLIHYAKRYNIFDGGPLFNKYFRFSTSKKKKKYNSTTCGVHQFYHCWFLGYIDYKQII